MPSSFFSPPANHLDPALFDNGDELKPIIRYSLVRAAEATLDQAGLKKPVKWLKMWLTGSAISYQWQADRGNGDLDVQIGIEYEQFLSDNPGYRGVDEYLMTDKINRYLKENLWPKMAHAHLGGKVFEVTFYWNYGVMGDISIIRPYAAYDLISNTWVVHPPKLPEDPRTLYPADWFRSTLPDDLASQRLLQRHTELSKLRDGLSTNEPNFVTANSGLRLIEAQAQSLFDEIHGGRHEAFSPEGKGYGDYHNFRWQQAKSNGSIERLHQIISSVEPRKDSYGRDIKSADEALTEAMTFRLGKRYA